MRVAVIIPNWNGGEWVTEALDSLEEQTFKDFKIIVVDNGSTDGSNRLIKRRYPGVEIIQLDRNYGFAGGVNRGIETALAEKTEFIALFNNDAVAEQNWLKWLIESAETNPLIGAVGSKQLRGDRQTIDSTGDFYSVWGLPFPRGWGELDSGQYDDKVKIFAAPGAACLYRAEMLRQVGSLDEDFFAYWEDVDLSFRARLAGWKVTFQPKAIIYHRVNATSANMGHFARYHTSKNFVYLYLKNMPGWLAWKYLPRFLGGFAMMSANSILRGQGAAMLQAWTQIILKFPATLAKRHRIQKGRRVKPSEIDRLLYRQIPPTSRIINRLRRS